MALAGLWDRWRSKDKSETKETFTIVTTKPSKFAAQFHNRMPLMLEADSWDLWMKGDPEAAAALMKHANDDVLVSRPVSKAVLQLKYAMMEPTKWPRVRLSETFSVLTLWICNSKQMPCRGNT